MTTVTLSNIGRFACFKHLATGIIAYGNCVDTIPDTDLPKRIRIQRGIPSLHGEVIMPSEYEFRCWADEEED